MKKLKEKKAYATWTSKRSTICLSPCSLGFPLSVILSLCLRFRSIILLNSILSQVHNEPWRSTWTSITATGCKICRREKHRGQEEGLKKTPVQPLPVIACRVEDTSSDRMLQRSTDLLNSESFEPANELDWKLSHQSPDLSMETTTSLLKRMHDPLNSIWKESFRVMKWGYRYGVMGFIVSWVFPANGVGGCQKPWVITGYGLSQRWVMTKSTVDQMEV